MILITHIVIALAGVLQASYMLFAPSKRGLHLSYALLGATLASGTILVVTAGTHLLQGCMMGLLYTGFATFSIARTRQTLAKNSAQ